MDDKGKGRDYKFINLSRLYVGMVISFNLRQRERESSTI